MAVLGRVTRFRDHRRYVVDVLKDDGGCWCLHSFLLPIDVSPVAYRCSLVWPVHFIQDGVAYLSVHRLAFA
ncbi:hypothetical protein D3C75_1102550 [compost metagenome]